MAKGIDPDPPSVAMLTAVPGSEGFRFCMSTMSPTHVQTPGRDSAQLLTNFEPTKVDPN
jgi:hypothetical protein